jgi:LysR family transcriptional regulator, carnitine catabolism transcriptional activator
MTTRKIAARVSGAATGWGVADGPLIKADLQRGRVVLGASPTVAACFLPDAISPFREANPAIEIVLQDDFYGRELDRISRGTVNLAVIPFESDDEAFDSEFLFTDRFLLAMPPGHALTSRPSLRLADLATEPLIGLGPQAAAWSTAKRTFDAAGLTFSPALQTRNSLISIALVRAGFGLAFVTEMLAKTLPVQRRSSFTDRRCKLGAPHRHHYGQRPRHVAGHDSTVPGLAVG